MFEKIVEKCAKMRVYAVALLVTLFGVGLVQAADGNAPAAAQTQKATVQRAAQMTPEKRAELRAQRTKAMAERKAAMDAKQLEIIKKYVSDEAKAKALLEELKAVRMPARRPPAAAKK